MRNVMAKLGMEDWRFVTPISPGIASSDPRLKDAKASATKKSQTLTYINTLERAVNGGADNDLFFIMEDDIVPLSGDYKKAKQEMDQVLRDARGVDFDMILFEY
jgi:hypothetical protein